MDDYEYYADLIINMLESSKQAFTNNTYVNVLAEHIASREMVSHDEAVKRADQLTLIASTLMNDIIDDRMKIMTRVSVYT